MDDLQYEHMREMVEEGRYVLNLVINGWPSIQLTGWVLQSIQWVLNLVINGWPSILYIVY